MSHSARSEAVQAFVAREARQVQFPQHVNSNGSSTPMKVSELFGCNVYGMTQLKETLPKPIFKNLMAQLRGEGTLDRPTADAVAHAVKVWALERGATHFTHWFQPLTDSTAEKHDSFLSLEYESLGGMLVSKAIDAFSGAQLLQAEPDASSFPNGGARSTFEARGYTLWDPNSPMFVQSGPHETVVLYIPSVFISYHGEALDEKMVLLRSCEAVNKATIELLGLLNEDDDKVKRVHVTLGTEQEFFLVDRALYTLRPDLKITARTLVGMVPPKHQQLEDHYFGHIPSRVLSAISEAELELWKLGVPLKTRHNEVAPQQFEMAPVFEEAVVAVDHNLLTMQVLHRVAHRHGLKALFHEKPFKGVNGSGKHCNWSLVTDDGKNLLEPGEAPENNNIFLLMLVSILAGLKNHAGLLRASIASASNDHRLGANEAPPSIISAFLGAHLTVVLDGIAKGLPTRELVSPMKVSTRPLKLGAAAMDLKVATLPEVARDLTDRNRTSPFAFTGNKFEFRAVGSKQSPSFPVTVLNAAVAAGLKQVTEALKRENAGRKPSSENIQNVLRHFIKETAAVRFEGDGYSDAWVVEAEKRGLLNLRTAPEAFSQLLCASNVSLLTESLAILSSAELQARHQVLCEKYAKDLVIEAKTLCTMVRQHFIWAIFRCRKDLAAAAIALEQRGQSSKPEDRTLSQLTNILEKMEEKTEKLEKQTEKIGQIDQPKAEAEEAVKLVKMLAELREEVDLLEGIMADDLYPFPKYTEILLL